MRKTANHSDLHDNARSYVANLTWDTVKELSQKVPAAYSPDIPSVDYHLFLGLKTFCLRKVIHEIKRGLKIDWHLF